MAEVIMRLERAEDKKLFYVQFEKEARNGVLRLWNTYSQAGFVVAHKERETFQDADGVARYLKNARKQYETQGFKEPKAEKPAKAAKGATDTIVLE